MNLVAFVTLAAGLISPAFSDRNLYGKWEADNAFGEEFSDEFLGGADVVMRLTIEPDGDFQAEIRMTLAQEWNFLEFVLAQLDTIDLEIPPMDLPLVETFSTRAAGTYSIVEENEIRFEITNEEQLINDQPAVEFVTEAANQMAPLVADVLEVPEEGREEFINGFADFLLGNLGEDDTGLVEGFQEEGILFKVEGDRMVLSFGESPEEEESLEFQRVPDFTAVEISTWGWIKSRQ